MFIKLYNYLFDSCLKVFEIRIYIELLRIKPSLEDEIITTLDVLLNRCGYSADTKNIKKVKNALNLLDNLQIIKIYKDKKTTIKKNDVIKITLEDLSDESKGFTKVEKNDIRIIDEFNFNTNECVLYFFMKRFYNEQYGKAFVSYRTMEEKIGLTNKTSQKILDRFCELGIYEKFNPQFFNCKDGDIRRSNNEYRNFNNNILKEKAKVCKEVLGVEDNIPLIISESDSLFERFKDDNNYILFTHQSFYGFGEKRIIKDTIKYLIPKETVA